jgi:hypothetical protein
MGMRLPFLLLALSPSLLLLPASCAPAAANCDAGPIGEAPTAAGAWKGTYECNNNLQKMSAALAVTDNGQLDGEAFLDYDIMILAQPLTLTGRANIDDGRAGEDDALLATVDVLDNSQGLADWNLRVALNADGDELNGELFRTLGNGDELSCAVELERVVVTDDVYTPAPMTDGG